MLEELKAGVQTIRYQLSTLFTSNGQSPFSTIYLEIEEGHEYEEEMALICEEMIKQRLEGMKNHTKLCHGDFNPSNVIVKEDETIYVIDWSHVTQGNASGDAARTYLLFSMEGKAELADKYLELFASKSGISKTNIQRWIPIVATTQMSKGNENEREFLSKWIDVVDYE